MTDHVSAHPLCWPAAFPRNRARRNATFKVGYNQALNELADELDKLGGTNPVLSTNMPLRLDGMPRADVVEPADPGVALYFELNGKRMCMPQDLYTSVRDNIRAIGLTLVAMRTIDRHGGGHTLEAAFTGFQALPAPEAPAHWTSILNVPATASEADINHAWRTKIKEQGGAEGPHAAIINVARDRALQEVRA